MDVIRNGSLVIRTQQCPNYIPIRLIPTIPGQDLVPSTMPFSISLSFENLLEIALGKTQDVPNVANKDIPEIIQYLREKITGQILENVDVGLDPENPGTILHRRSPNYTMKLWKLELAPLPLESETKNR